MIDDPEQPEDDTRIGVGMGGSCPSCRAPVDLGQEFCLECGAAIRFSSRQKRTNSGGGTRPAAGAAATGGRKGFPWLPFVILLVLLSAGTALFIVDGDDGGTKSRDRNGTTTEPPLPSITNSTPETSSQAETTTVDDCSSVDPLAGTQPTQPNSTADAAGAAGTDPGALGSTGETIPELSPSPGMLGDNDPAADPFADDVPDTQADDAGRTTATVDRNGNPCSGSSDTAPTDTTATSPLDTSGRVGTGDTTTSPSDTTTTSPTSPTTTPTDSTSSTTSWPDKDGWTVVVFGFPEQSRANDRAADLQADGFESGVLFSTDYGSLCPGFYVVFSGVFGTKTQAENQEKRLRGKYQGMYVRKITREGTPKGCSS